MRSQATQPSCDVFTSAQQVSNMSISTMTSYDAKVGMDILPTLQTGTPCSYHVKVKIQ